MDTQALKEKILQLKGLTDKERKDLVALLTRKKKYGLVWEEKPEEVEERLRTQLPVLEEVRERALLSNDPAAPNHILIEGDNLEALVALTYTHEGKVDVIYIDPPYNTGNKDFSYNDSYVDAEDGYRHSKWLSFMSKRLKIAKQLLSDRGVIFISIDDNEQAQLKLLCDEVFDRKNFIATLIWRGGRRNMSKWISTSHEYMLLYSKSIDFCRENDVQWYEQKLGLAEIYTAANKFLKDSNNNYEEASDNLKKWYQKLSDDNPAKDHKHYCWIDKKGVYFASDISRGGGGGPKWEIVNPNTGNLVKIPQRGWAYSKIEDLYSDIDNGLIHFNGDGVPCKKRYLKDNETQILETVFYKDRRGSSKRLRELMGRDCFSFPKDEYILQDKLKSFSLKSSIILDFFAGSGTTLHATMQLNKEDGGHRQCILVTNNENKICEEVTYVRNKRVIQGYVTPKGDFVEGLKANTLRYYRTKLLPRAETNQNRRALMEACTELLCIQQDLYAEQPCFAGRKLNPRKARYFAQGKRKMLVIYDEQTVDTFAELLREMEVEEKIRIYLFSFNGYPYTDNFMEVLDKVELCALPQAIYNVYKRVLPQAAGPANEEEEMV